MNIEARGWWNGKNKKKKEVWSKSNQAKGVIKALWTN